MTNNRQQADTGTKMVHLGNAQKVPSSPKEFLRVLLKTVIVDWSKSALEQMMLETFQVRFTADGQQMWVHTFPYIEAGNKSAQIEHEATTSKIGEDQIYCNQRGIDIEKAIALIVNGFSKDVLNKLPMEFAVEAQKLLEISLEGSVG